MEKILYLECYSGISGDMTVAALLGLGADQGLLLEGLKSLPLKGFEVEIKKVIKSGVEAWDFLVRLDSSHENHDHDMAYLHGHEGEGHHTHDHEGHDHHGHSHEGHDHHGHHHHHGDHEHRGLAEVSQIIEESRITPRAKRLALDIFEVLADAEAKAHNVPVSQVHFHEVGAVDSIVDIVAAAICLDNLDIRQVIVPELWEGKGTIRCQHGVLPVPVPAVANVIRDASLPLRITQVEGELVTPTGAAIAAAICTGNTLPETFVVEKTGVGAGKRQYDCPGILRAMLIRPAAREERDVICKLETNIDDCTGENLGFVMERLFEAGAKDVHYTPVFMKKSRPAWLLCVLCREEDRERMEEIIFSETTTIGIRRMSMERTVLRRRQETAVTPHGEVQVKVCTLKGKELRYPEYDSLAALCKRTGLSFREAYEEALRATL
ncbi:MAG: nickel pincer cofactor biosynthesis protein LarC [Eubacteriales bacterium]|nr:nickel pincer cofactor biosynthesis protein LarC [Eubacteriales bacterium]